MATQRVVVAGSSVTAPQLSDMFRQIGDGSLTGSHIQAFLDHRNPFEIPMDTESQLARWQVLLQERFSIELSGDINGPKRVPGFDRLIVVPQGITMNRIVAEMRERFNVWTYADDLDKSVPTNDRTNAATYAIWVRDRVEADEEFANLSARNLANRGVKSITLMERLLLELAYWAETGKHLDAKNWTLCSGSRPSVGDVPFVGWSPGLRRLHVCWSHPSYASSFLRAREVVS